MVRPARLLIFAAAATLLAGMASAQTYSSEPNANDVGHQVQSGANRIGNGFEQMGLGVKQGAILTWDSIVDGVHTTTSHFSGYGGSNYDTSNGNNNPANSGTSYAVQPVQQSPQ